jgi:hypothetical protein
MLFIMSVVQKSVNTHQGQSVKFPNVTTLRFNLQNSRVIVPEEFCHRFIQDWVEW